MGSWKRWLARKLAAGSGLGVVELTEHEAGRLRDDPELSCRALLYEEAISIAGASISLAEARFLGRLVAELEGDGPIVEIGTFYGWSAAVMAMCKEPSRRLLSVDHYGWAPLGLDPREKQRLAGRMLQEARDALRVELLAMDKAHFYAAYAGQPPALVFLDAVHTYEETRADVEWAERVGAETICGHDYCEQWPGVMQVVDELGGPRQLVGSLWVL